MIELNWLIMQRNEIIFALLKIGREEFEEFFFDEMNSLEFYHKKAIFH
jgi:hypothetical protein